MSQLQDLARLLTCSGYTAHPDGEGAYMIYTHDGCAVLKHWTEGCFGKEEIITANIRAGPTASYITESSIVTITQFDEDEEDWVENNNLPRCVVHPEGQLTATLGASGNVVVVFQNEEGRLVYMQEPDEEDTAWTVTEVEDAHKPAFGTPLSIRIEPDSDTSMLRVFYISSSDGAVHCITRVVGDIIWADAFTLSAARGTPLKRIFVANGSEKMGTIVYAVTHKGSVLQLAANQAPLDLGRVEKDGGFVPSTTAECSIHIFGLLPSTSTLEWDSRVRRDVEDSSDVANACIRLLARVRFCFSTLYVRIHWLGCILFNGYFWRVIPRTEPD